MIKPSFEEKSKRFNSAALKRPFTEKEHQPTVDLLAGAYEHITGMTEAGEARLYDLLGLTDDGVTEITGARAKRIGGRAGNWKFHFYKSSTGKSRSAIYWYARYMAEIGKIPKARIFEILEETK